MSLNTHSPSQEKVLVIEAESIVGDKIASCLRQEGYNVALVKNGVDGLKQIFDILPGLIILDITLPGLDGYDILYKKQAEPMLAKIPLFLLSTQGVPINMRRVPPGSVTEFIIELHVDPAEILSKVNRHFPHKGETVPAASGADAITKKKILWVEDDKLIGTILSKKFTSSGFELFHAKNGEEALDILKTVVPDAIVLDLLLPGMSGFDILQKIRADEHLKNTPVIILSNLSKPSDIEKAKILGARKFLIKAASSLDQIVAEVKEICK